MFLITINLMFLKTITLVSSDSGEITYEFNGDKHHISVEEDDDKELGTFPIGDYNLKASKDMEGKNFKGAITIDMSESDSIAYESFKQKRFNVDTEGGYILDNVKIYANGKEIGDGFHQKHMVLMIQMKKLSFTLKVHTKENF